jgi:hypothetical protein
MILPLLILAEGSIIVVLQQAMDLLRRLFTDRRQMNGFK